MYQSSLSEEDTCDNHGLIDGEGRIPDDKMTASSSIVNHEPIAARYQQKGWEPESDYANSWLKLGFDVPMTLISIRTLGRSVRGLKLIDLMLCCVNFSYGNVTSSLLGR